MPGEKGHDVYIKVYETKEFLYIDQTKWFSFQSARVHKYIMALCKIDRNIDAEPVKSRKEKEMIQAYWELLAHKKERGACNPEKHILQNEASEEFKTAIKEQCK